MQIEDINDFLIQHATGKTKEQIAFEVKDIKIKSAQLDKLNQDIKEKQALYDTLINQNEQLEKKIKIHRDIVKDLDKAKEHFNMLAPQIPKMRIEVEMYESKMQDYQSKLDALTKQEQETDNKILSLKEEQAKLDAKIKADAEQSKILELKTLKLSKVIEEQAKQVSFIETNKKPIHVHLREIQNKLDKEGIKLNIVHFINS